MKKAAIGIVPDDWVVAPLGNFLSLCTYGFTNPMPTTNSGPYKVVAKDIRDGIIDFKTARHTSEYAFRSQLTNKSRPRVNDILLTKDGSIGRVAICNHPTICINQSVALLRSNGLIFPLFLKYLLLSPYYQQKMADDAEGTTIKHIYITRVDKMEVAIPPLPTQQAIARVLRLLDDKIELNRQMNETLEATAQAIFKSWFVDFDPVKAKAEGRQPAGMDAETAALFPDGFEEEDGREVPKGWGVGTIQDLCVTIENGGTPKRMESTFWEGGTIPWFKTGELIDGPLIDSDEKITELGLTESACRLWHPKTILIALYASPTVGRLGILEIPGTANQACSALVAKISYGSLFLYYSLLFSRDQLQNIAVGAAQQNINQQVLKEHKVLIPDTSVTQTFQHIIEPLYKKKVHNIQQSHLLAQIRDALLPKLMSSEINISQPNEIIQESV